ncbi:MAG TPA: DUF1428 domain-containing protein [Candidatus Paceibacterota bacterium]
MKKGTYVDGFVLTIPKKKAGAYRRMAAEAAKVWKRFGALDYKECVIDDAKPTFVTFTFGKMAKVKPSEQVWFSYIVYKSRAHRDAVNKKVMAHFDKKYKDKKDMPMPFDMKRMAYAGFKVVVSG